MMASFPPGASASGAGKRRMEEHANVADAASSEWNFLRVRPYGSGQEVGRSCLVLKFKGKTIMLDCGVLPSFRGEDSLPLLREIDPAEIDIIIITHFHLDHCAALPYFTERMVGFKGRIFATHATIAVMRLILSDFLRVSGSAATAAGSAAAGGGASALVGGDSSGPSSSSSWGLDREADIGLYDESDMLRCLSRMEPVDLKQRVSTGGISFTLLNAGHVLGAAMVLMEIAGVKILYTGDYSGEDDRHLRGAEVPPGLRPDILICESTAGMTVHESRADRERRLLAAVEKVVRRGGRCLLPLSALGAAQELMLILEEHWEKHPDLAASVPVYFACRMAESALGVYRTYLGAMSGPLQQAAMIRNPWDFRHVRSIRPPEFKDSGPCVVLAAPGMLQQGFSRRLFDRWAEDPKNGVVLAGYAVEGTLARTLESNPAYVETEGRRRLRRECLIERVSFHAHADMVHTNAFVEALKPSAIVLVHGERSEMKRLRDSLAKKYERSAGWRGVYMPSNNDWFRIEFAESKAARVVGSLAERIAQGGPGTAVGGVLVTRHFQHLLCAPSDLPRFTSLSTHTLSQKLHVPYRSSFSLLSSFVGAMYGDARLGEEDAATLPAGVSKARATLTVCEGMVTITHAPPDRVILTWAASPLADTVADSLVAVISQAEVSQVAIAATSRSCGHSHGKGTKGKACGHGHSHTPHAADLCPTPTPTPPSSTATAAAAAGGGGGSSSLSDVLTALDGCLQGGGHDAAAGGGHEVTPTAGTHTGIGSGAEISGAEDLLSQEGWARALLARKGGIGDYCGSGGSAAGKALLCSLLSSMLGEGCVTVAGLEGGKGAEGGSGVWSLDVAVEERKARIEYLAASASTSTPSATAAGTSVDSYRVSWAGDGLPSPADEALLSTLQRACGQVDSLLRPLAGGKLPARVEGRIMGPGQGAQ